MREYYAEGRGKNVLKFNIVFYIMEKIVRIWKSKESVINLE